MEYMEFLRQLVETDDADERMNLVEQYADSFKPNTEGTQDTAKMDEMLAKIDELQKSLDEQKKKYKDRFFSGVESEQTTSGETEETDAESITINDLFKKEVE